ILTHALARIMQLGNDARASVAFAALLVDHSDPLGERGVRNRSGRERTAQPRVEAARGETEHACHRTHRIDRLVLLHELESRGGIESLSRANQAAAFFRISRSSFSCRFSRRRRRSSSRSSVVRPSRPPSSTSACRIQLRIVCSPGSNSRASSATLRPARCNSIICRRNSGEYSRLAIVDSSSYTILEVSTKLGQLQDLEHADYVVTFSAPRIMGAQARVLVAWANLSAPYSAAFWTYELVMEDGGKWVVIGKKFSGAEG